MTDNPEPLPILVLTRPEPQSRALAEAVTGIAQVILSPIMEIRCAGPVPDLAPYAGLVLTSANAVPCVGRLSGKRVACVGERTAAAAREAGAEVVKIARNADDLVASDLGPGPFLHLRGEYARGDIARRLNAAGVQAGEAVVYTQHACELTGAARAAIEGDGHVVLPLYSPRSAHLVGQGLHPGPRLHAIAMSAAVAGAWAEETGASAEISSSPTGAEMKKKIVAALRRKVP